jgi:hypothetical protein
MIFTITTRKEKKVKKNGRGKKGKGIGKGNK